MFNFTNIIPAVAHKRHSLADSQMCRLPDSNIGLRYDWCGEELSYKN